MPTGRRHDGRRANELRAVTIHPGFVRGADGSCLIEVGRTRVICTASFVPSVPKWREGSGEGWLTAEYAMLPASTSKRKPRSRGKPDSRGIEIQRLIGRVLRNVIRLDRLGGHTVYLDCDVLEADGGTRTASVTGAYVALALGVRRRAQQDLCLPGVLTRQVAAVSVGMLDGRAILDMDYAEDAGAEVDLNVAMVRGGRFVEIQGTSERRPFDAEQLQQMLQLARRGVRKLMRLQKQAVEGGLKS